MSKSPSCLCASARSLDLKDVKVVTKLGGTVDDSELVDGMVFDHKARSGTLLHLTLRGCMHARQRLS